VRSGPVGQGFPKCAPRGAPLFSFTESKFTPSFTQYCYGGPVPRNTEFELGLATPNPLLGGRERERERCFQKPAFDRRRESLQVCLNLCTRAGQLLCFSCAALCFRKKLVTKWKDFY
jgi:hypothetical protein